MCISVNQCGRDQETYQSALPAEIWYQELLIMTNRDVSPLLTLYKLICICFLDFIYRLAKQKRS